MRWPSCASGPVDLMLLDIGLPGMNGLEVLTEARAVAAPPRVVMMTADDTSDALLRAFRDQADRFVRKPIAPTQVVAVVRDVLAQSAATTLPIEVASARPDWVELVAPCSLDVADRIHEFVMHLDADLARDVRESMGQAFRELLSNAIEWGGRLDPTHNASASPACAPSGCGCTASPIPARASTSSGWRMRPSPTPTPIRWNTRGSASRSACGPAAWAC